MACILILFTCQVFYKLHLDGQGEEIVLQDVLQAFDISQDKFLNWCILSGCDYLPNLKGIGIKKAKQIIDSKDDFLSVVEVLDIAPPDYRQKFNEAKIIFLHQTVIDPVSKKSVALLEWEDTVEKENHQSRCGKYPNIKVNKKLSYSRQMKIIQ